MNKLIKIFLIFILLILNIGLQSGPGLTDPPPCGYFSWHLVNTFLGGGFGEIPDFTITGDSRARFVADIHNWETFKNPTLNGKALMLPNQIKTIQNLGWASATASDDQRDIFAILQNQYKYKNSTRENI